MTAYVFHGLPGLYFYRDDFLNLYRIVDEPPLAYLFRPHGGHLLFTRNSLFYLFHAAFGTDAAWYFRIVLATHLLNVYLLFRVVQRASGCAFLASFGAALWGICPLHMGTLGWYSVYGQVVVCTIMLFILDRAARLAQEGSQASPALAISWAVLLLLASTSFGTGLGIAAVAPIVFFLILPPGRGRTWACVLSGALAVLLPILYWSTISIYASTFGVGPEVRVAKVMLASVANGRALSWVNAMPMLGSLFGFGVTGLVLGSDDVTQAFPDRRALIVSALSLTVVVVSVFLSSPRKRRWLIASLLLAIACYGIISVGRAKSGGVLATQLRYHYVALSAFTVALCVALARFRRLLRPIRFLRIPLLLAWAALAIYLQLGRVQQRPQAGQVERAELNWIRSRINLRATTAPVGSDVYIENGKFRGVGMMINYGRLFPGFAGVFIIYSPSNEIAGRRLFFVEQDPQLLATATGKRSATLLVSPAQAAAAREKRMRESAAQ
jgi:hypothetical protein